MRVIHELEAVGRVPHALGLDGVRPVSGARVRGGSPRAAPHSVHPRREKPAGDFGLFLPAIAALLAAGCGRSGAVAAASAGAGPGAAVAASEHGGGASAVIAPETAAGKKAPELVLRAAVPLDVDADARDEFQPSGLLLHEGRLLTVSDKHDRAIYGIDIDGDHARVRAVVSFEPPADAPPPLDFEGLSPAPDGGWLLASEGQRRVLHVGIDPNAAASSPRGRAHWFSPSLAELVRASGCLQKVNAGIEGIALSGQGRLVLAGEREPRCLIELEAADDLTSGHVWSMESAEYESEPGRHLDYSDLTLFHGSLYALVRNTYLVARLERTAEGWREGPVFSYRNTEHDPRFAYEDRNFGMAEGLALDEQRVYVVLDNNEHARVADGRDRRPLLFIFDRPPTL